MTTDLTLTIKPSRLEATEDPTASYTIVADLRSRQSAGQRALTLGGGELGALRSGVAEAESALFDLKEQFRRVRRLSEGRALELLRPFVSRTSGLWSLLLGAEDPRSLQMVREELRGRKTPVIEVKYYIPDAVFPVEALPLSQNRLSSIEEFADNRLGFRGEVQYKYLAREMGQSLWLRDSDDVLLLLNPELSDFTELTNLLTGLGLGHIGPYPDRGLVNTDRQLAEVLVGYCDRNLRASMTYALCHGYTQGTPSGKGGGQALDQVLQFRGRGRRSLRELLSPRTPSTESLREPLDVRLGDVSLLVGRLRDIAAMSTHLDASTDDGSLVDQAPVVVLNACSIGRGDASFALIHDLVGPSARSVIAPRVPVPLGSARPIGARILRGLAAREPVGAALRNARLDLLGEWNPTGLIYSLYGRGDVRRRVVS